MNQVTLAGNLASDPELRYTPSGVAVCNISIAVNRRVKEGDGWTDELDGFFRCTAWRDMAENVVESLKKGQRVIVTGRVQMKHWEDSDGNKHQSVEVIVSEVGPSLRWAVASVQKSTQNQNGNGQRASQPADDWANPPEPAAAAGGF